MAKLGDHVNIPRTMAARRMKCIAQRIYAQPARQVLSNYGANKTEFFNSIFFSNKLKDNSRHEIFNVVIHKYPTWRTGEAGRKFQQG